MAEKVAVFVNGAALNGQVVAPERNECSLEPRSPIARDARLRRDDREFGPLLTTGVEIVEVRVDRGRSAAV